MSTKKVEELLRKLNHELDLLKVYTEPNAKETVLKMIESTSITTFAGIPDVMKDDKDIFKAAILNDKTFFYDIPHEYFDLETFIKCMDINMDKTIRYINFIPKDLRSNREFYKRLYIVQPRYIAYTEQSKELILDALDINPEVFDYIRYDLIKDRDIIKKYLFSTTKISSCYPYYDYFKNEL